MDIIPNSQSKSVGFGCNGTFVEGNFGRFPANVITDGSSEVANGMPNTKSTIITRSEESIKNCNLRKGQTQNDFGNKSSCASNYEDEGSAMRYFYQAKASKKDRDDGLDFLNKIGYELKPNTPKEIVDEIKKVLQESVS